MSKAGYCQHDAGILDNDELSDAAKTSFIKDVLKELRLGSAAVKHPLFPVNLNLPPQPSMANIPLDDPKSFPEFHKNVLGQYRDIARALDAKSRYTFLPVCCPVSLAVSLGADVPKLKFPSEFITYGFALPLLAVKLGEPVPLDLAKKFPSLLGLPIPNLKLPELDFDVKKFPDLFSFKSSLNGVPPKLINAALELLVKMPQLALGILSLDLSVIYDVVVSSKMFGDFDVNKSLVWAVAQKTLAIRAAECMVFYVVGTTMGSSAGGIVGGLASAMGYVPPDPPTGSKKDPADVVVKAAKSVKDQSLSNDVKKTKEPKGEARYLSFLFPQEIDDGSLQKINLTVKNVLGKPTGPYFARACSFRAGASSDFFTKKLTNYNNVLEKLENEAKLLNAHVRPTKTSYRPKVGNIIVSNEVSVVVISVNDDGITSKVVFAGDKDTDGSRTSIVEKNVQLNFVEDDFVIVSGSEQFKVRYVIDVNKLSSS